MGRYKVDPITGELTLMNPSMSDIPIYQGVSGSTASVSGLVPQAQAGDEEKALLGNGTWGSVSGGETISYADWLQLTPEEQTHGEYFIPDYSGSILPTGGFDNVPTAGSQNPVTSNGIYEAIDAVDAKITNHTLYFTAIPCTATTGNFATKSDDKITSDHVVTSCVFANSAAITTKPTWTTNNGSVVLNGTCTTATTVDLVLVKKQN